MNTIRKLGLKLGICLAVLAVMLVLGAPAKAGSCAAGDVCTILLTDSNVNQLDGTVVTVTIDNTGENTVLSFQDTSDTVTNTALGIDQVGWNTGTVLTYPGTWSDAGSGSMDGFGTFIVQSADPASTDGISSPVSFTLNGLVTVFADNLDGNEFAVHKRYDGNCSGFIGGTAGSTSSIDNFNCTGSPVPEPASLTLLGTALLGLGTKLRKRLLKK